MSDTMQILKWLAGLAMGLVLIIPIVFGSERQAPMDLAQENPDVFFFEGFEDAGYADHFTDVSHQDNQKLVGDAFEGASCLRIRVQKDTHYGASVTIYIGILRIEGRLQMGGGIVLRPLYN